MASKELITLLVPLAGINFLLKSADFGMGMNNFRLNNGQLSRCIVRV